MEDIQIGSNFHLSSRWTIEQIVYGNILKIALKISA